MIVDPAAADVNGNSLIWNEFKVLWGGRREAGTWWIRSHFAAPLVPGVFPYRILCLQDGSV